MEQKHNIDESINTASEISDTELEALINNNVNEKKIVNKCMKGIFINDVNIRY